MLESFPLSTTVCETLLLSGVVGRVGMVAEGDPVVQPMNYSVVDGAIVMRTSPDSQVALHADGRRLAFEVDPVRSRVAARLERAGAGLSASSCTAPTRSA